MYKCKFLIIYKIMTVWYEVVEVFPNISYANPILLHSSLNSLLMKSWKAHYFPPRSANLTIHVALDGAGNRDFQASVDRRLCNASNTSRCCAVSVSARLRRLAWICTYACTQLYFLVR